MYLDQSEKERALDRRAKSVRWPMRFVGLVAFMLVVLSIGLSHSRIPVKNDLGQAGALVPEPQVARVMSMGFEALVSDYYWLKAVQVAGGNRSTGREEYGNYLARLVDLVTSLNPHVGHAYRFAAVWLTQSEQEVREANRLLRRGIEHHPEDWRNWFYLGFNQFYYLGENEKAADTIAVASDLPRAPAYLSRLVARLKAESGGLEVAEVLLRQMVEDAKDDTSRRGYLSALDEIEIERRARFLDSARERFKELQGRDLGSVSELVLLADPVLLGLPEAYPSSLDVSPGENFRWEIDSDTGLIVSSYYGRRYALNFTPDRAVRLQEWRESKERGVHIGPEEHS